MKKPKEENLYRNNVFRYVYYFLMIVLLADILTSYYAYTLAVNALGYRNFGSEDYFWEMVSREGKRVQLPNYTFYKFLALLSIISIISFPLLVLINFALNRAWRNIIFEPRIVLITLFVIAAYILLNFFTDVFSWFAGFVFD